MPNKHQMPAKDQVPYKGQKRPECPSYKTSEDFLTATNFRKKVEDYHDAPFYDDLRGM